MSAGAREELSRMIDTIERSYEFMLAYAAQGRDSEPSSGDGPGIRTFVTELVEAIACLPEQLESIEPAETELKKRVGDFGETIAQDCEKANRAARVVLASPVISSQLIDNLNASVHLRTLLTDLFIIDEALPR